MVLRSELWSWGGSVLGRSPETYMLSQAFQLHPPGACRLLLENSPSCLSSKAIFLSVLLPLPLPMPKSRWLPAGPQPPQKKHFPSSKNIYLWGCAPRAIWETPGSCCLQEKENGCEYETTKLIPLCFIMCLVGEGPATKETWQQLHGVANQMGTKIRRRRKVLPLWSLSVQQNTLTISKN